MLPKFSHLNVLNQSNICYPRMISTNYCPPASNANPRHSSSAYCCKLQWCR